MERIVIKKFGPIKDVDLEINDFMIFIGPQASGKSTIAKLIYFYKNLQNEFRSFLLERASFNIIRRLSEEYERNLALLCIKDYFIDIFSEARIYKNSEVQFHFRRDFIVKVKIDEEGELTGFLPDQFSSQFEKTLREARKIFDEEKSKFSSVRNSISFLIDDFVKDIFGKVISDNVYIPSGRGFISTISNQIFNLKTESLDYFIKEFASIIGLIKGDIPLENVNLQNYSEEVEKWLISVYNLLKERQFNILKGRYSYDAENDKAGIEIGNKNFIPLDMASSGQQEAVWLVQYFIFRILTEPFNTSFTIIEEPEAHLYPESQKNITELIVLLSNSGINQPIVTVNNQVVITTHSPYILASINNLLYANKVGRTHEKEVSERIDKNLWLEYKRVGAYFVGGEDNEGGIKRIMDDELELIENQYIDSASQIINKEFDFIFALEG